MKQALGLLFYVNFCREMPTYIRDSFSFAHVFSWLVDRFFKINKVPSLTTRKSLLTVTVLFV